MPKRIMLVILIGALSGATASRLLKKSVFDANLLIADV
jgi:hypothetical protein